MLPPVLVFCWEFHFTNSSWIHFQHRKLNGHQHLHIGLIYVQDLLYQPYGFSVVNLMGVALGLGGRPFSMKMSPTFLEFVDLQG